MTEDLTSVDTHFAFGKNWESYSSLIDEAAIESSTQALVRLLGRSSLEGTTFLDIGCGSGLHSLAALRLGAARLLSVDLDPDSIATTRAVLDRFMPGRSFVVEQGSVFDLDPAASGRFDVVYSWGVLHHTGDMTTALRRAVGMVAPGGVFLFALYRKTWLCPFWTVEKRWYTKASPAAQRRGQAAYRTLHRSLAAASALMRGRTRRADSARERGMDFDHDIHDWLGGYPYESILPDDVEKLMTSWGLRHEASFLCAPTRGRTHGLLGSCCDEYRYIKKEDG